MTNQFDWMREAIYEPQPAPVARRSRRPHPFLILAALAIISGALIALNQLGG